MMTRKATIRDLESKLRHALEELKDSRDTCNQLLREREDSEEEINSVIQRNTVLKKDLADLHVKYQDIISHRDQLLGIINNFDQCSAVFEQTLTRNNELETELRDANRTIQHFEEDRRLQQFAETQNLYEELIGTPGGHAMKFDLSAKTDFEDSCIKIKLNSKNKFRKYVRINRFIAKTNKLIKKQKCFYKNVLLRKERLDLVDTIEIYSQKLLESRCKYDLDVEQLQAEMSRLQQSLDSLTSLYSSAQEQINEHILAANKLLDLDNHNTGSKSLPTINISPVQECFELFNINLQLSSSDSISCSQKSESAQLKESENVLIFSDRLGIGYGSLLSKKLNCAILNNCMPDAPLEKITECIKTSNLHCNSTIIIMLGNSSRINKTKLLQLFSVLADLQMLEYYHDLKHYWLDGYGHNLTYRQACMAIKTMFENFSEKGDPHAMFLFAHSGTLLKILTHLDLYKPESPLRGNSVDRERPWRLSDIDCFASNLAFVLYRCKGEDHVLTLHQERIIKLPMCETELCPLKHLLEYFHDSIYNCDYTDMCRLQRDTNNNSS